MCVCRRRTSRARSSGSTGASRTPKSDDVLESCAVAAAFFISFLMSFTTTTTVPERCFPGVAARALARGRDRASSRELQIAPGLCHLEIPFCSWNTIVIPSLFGWSRPGHGARDTAQLSSWPMEKAKVCFRCPFSFSLLFFFFGWMFRLLLVGNSAFG